MRSETKEQCISGECFRVTYRIQGSEKEACSQAKDICFEQTVELPEELITDKFIRDYVVGRIESFTPWGRSGFEAVISYAKETAAGELTQLLNVIFGNISIKPGIRVCALELPKSMLGQFSGPRFGPAGMRKFFALPERPLLCTALKPMGCSAEQLANLAYRCALGGIDIIKDDHSLTNQLFAPFKKRVELCAEAVGQANAKTGNKSVYVANVTAPFDQIFRRIELAKKAGAKGIMLAPGVVGWDALRHIAADDNIGLPIFSHPALQGSFIVNADSGMAHGLLLGYLPRLCGADAVIYPNFGGRFSFTKEDCADIVRAASTPLGHIRPVFPCPGGGMSLQRIPELLKFYGKDAIFLVGAGLFTYGADFSANCRYFRELVIQYAEGL
ncbi:MAG: RuBisCO large subunit C-terminal-like domain-containing protein [Candidatus Omnitrophota bacterium]